MKSKLFYLIPIISLLSCTQQTVKLEGVSVSIPQNSTIEEVEKLAVQVRPSYRQLDYQEREMLGFIHIGMNTFTGAEWGTGQESPSIFNPSELNADEWVKTFKEAGVTGVILVAKHHDGFCVWPSKYTNHTIANSPWRNGKGDMVKEVADACKKYDMKLCLYLSPWDMHDPSYGADAYNDYYVHQLEELLTNYGPIYLLWFDGAGVNSKTSGKEMNFDWERIFKKARELQPDVLLSGAAPDIRWVGNEAGRGRETEWSVQGIDDENILFGGEVKGHKAMAKNLGSLEELMNKKRLVWYPSRGGLPLRKGWFYNANTDNTVKSLEYLVNSYFSTVGQNSNLLPNLSPDKTGRFPQKDAEQLVRFGKIIAEMKKTDYAKGASATALTDWENKTGSLFDETPYTSWNTKEGIRSGEIEVTLKNTATFNVIKLQENVKDFGQRIEAFSIEAFIDNKWQEVAKSTTVGFRKMLRLPQLITTNKLKINILHARESVSLGNISLYRLPDFEGEEPPEFAPNNYISMNDWSLKTQGMRPLQGNPNALVINSNNTPSSQFEYVPETDNAFIISFNGKEHNLTEFTYIPNKTDNESGHIDYYELYTSLDGKNWGKPIKTGRFNNVVNNPVDQVVSLTPVKAKFFKIKVTKATKNKISIVGFRFN